MMCSVPELHGNNLQTQPSSGIYLADKQESGKGWLSVNKSWP